MSSWLCNQAVYIRVMQESCLASACLLLKGPTARHVQIDHKSSDVYIEGPGFIAIMDDDLDSMLQEEDSFHLMMHTEEVAKAETFLSRRDIPTPCRARTAAAQPDTLASSSNCPAPTPDELTPVRDPVLPVPDDPEVPLTN